MYSTSKAALTRQLAFSLILLSTLISCSESGSVGAGFVDESEIKVDTLILADVPQSSADAYLGKITYSPIGKFNDPLFGEISSFAFFKPGIIRASSDVDLTNSVNLVMRLNVDINNVYGDQGGNPSFSVYRVTDLWRGSAYRLSDEVTYNSGQSGPFINLVGSFEFNDVDTTGFVEFPLAGSFKSEYVQYYNNDSDDRDSTYRFEEYGLAIVPDENVNELIYARFSTSRMLIFENESDTTTNIMLDWAYDISVENETVNPQNITLSNTYEKYSTLNFETIADQIVNTNFVRAELLINEDTEAIQSSLPAGTKRTEDLPIRLKLGPSNDIPFDLGFSNTSSLAVKEGSEYRFNVTSLINAYLFGDTEIEEVYLYAGQNSGYLGFSTFFGPSASPELAPKVLIYTLEGEN